MSKNYSTKQKNQHEPLDFKYNEYIDISSDQIDNYDPNETSYDVEVRMSHSLHDMRREYKRNIKKLNKLYLDKAPKLSKYKFENAKSSKMPLSRIRIAQKQALRYGSYKLALNSYNK